MSNGSKPPGWKEGDPEPEDNGDPERPEQPKEEKKPE